MDEWQQRERQRREHVVTFAADRRLRYEWRVEDEAVLRRLRPRPGERILDAGCGIGRLTSRILRAGARVVALDFAHARLRHLRLHAPPASPGALVLAQADLTRLPLAPAAAFDAIVCTQVLEHLPTPQARQSLLAAFRALLRPGGRLLLTVYNYSEPWRRRGEPKQGIHPSGIFYHAYNAQELAAELSGFALCELCGVINLLPHTYRLFPLLGPLGRAFDHRASRHPALSHKWGHLLLAHAQQAR
jgi:2-polyprenyl-3-methyl-5-hydroxy-6-metoxy-1,4-benzoquinol methylase